MQTARNDWQTLEADLRMAGSLGIHASPVGQKAPSMKFLRVLIVDDDPQMRELVALALHGECEVIGQAKSGAEAVELVRQLSPDVVIMDVEMPGMDGPTATEILMHEHPQLRIVAFTGHVGSESVIRMIIAGAVGYAVKGGDPETLVQAIREAGDRKAGHVDPAAVPGLFESVLNLAREEQWRRLEAERLHADLRENYSQTIRALATALRSRDNSTQDHVDRVTDWAIGMGKRLRLSEDDLRDVEYGAIFHDIGKIGIPDSILQNTDDLDESEWALIKQHTVMGEQIIEPIGFLRNVARIVRHSHEYWDGTGYPDGLKGEEIPLASRIVLLCDAFDAMTAGRTYQAAMTHEVALERIRELSGKHFDPKLVPLFVEVVHEEDARLEEREKVSAGK